jgi:hypothetical protein
LPADTTIEVKYGLNNKRVEIRMVDSEGSDVAVRYRKKDGNTLILKGKRKIWM